MPQIKARNTRRTVIRLAACALSFGLMFAWFFWSRGRADIDHTLIHMAVDDYIPLLKVFIIPYVSWYPFIMLVPFIFAFRDGDDFWRLLISFFGGTYLCLVYITFFPTGIDFRPDSIPGSDPLAWMVNLLYKLDRPVNVFPSLHCYGALVLGVGVACAKRVKPIVRISVLLWSLVICASTVFVKQHSLADLIAGIIIALAFYGIVCLCFGLAAVIRARKTGAADAQGSDAA